MNEDKNKSAINTTILVIVIMLIILMVLYFSYKLYNVWSQIPNFLAMVSSGNQ